MARHDVFREHRRIRYERLLLAPLAFVLLRLVARHPATVERIYSRGLFPVIGQLLNFFTGWFSFSWAELTVWALILAGVYWIIVTIRRVLLADGGQRLAALWRRVAGVLVWLAGIYFAYIMLWGLNYDRQPFSIIAGIEVRPSSTAELAALCSDLINRTNAARLQVQEDANGVMRLNDSTKSALRRASLGYQAIARTYPVLGGHYGRPKFVVSSGLWSYTGTAGLYFPWTGEANVNTAMPAAEIPAAATHEMAHQRGFAREDEANYIAYLVCEAHPDADYRYSGLFSALTESLYALYQRDPAQYTELVKGLSDGVKRDLQREADFWQRYEGVVADATDHINDTYLKSNGQTDGVQSYGRMVDLLLAEYRQKQGK